jgi:cytochrome c biogenesis protein CcmG, thiol:disulfide interchange protein DsbE
LDVPAYQRRAVLFAASAVALAALTRASVAATVGQRAPEFELPGAAGAVKLSDLRGKVVYVDFWASWCAPCKQSIPWLNEMHARYRAQGLEIVGVNVDARRSDADQFLAQVPARFTLAFDARGDTPGRYAAKGMPSSFLIGRDGAIVAMHVGFRTEDGGRIEGEIRRALGIN